MKAGGYFAGLSVLDVGAASGGFSVPFADRGAKVTAVEPNLPLSGLLMENTARFPQGQVELVRDLFENVDLDARGWKGAFDLVFVSMSPAIVDWGSVESVLSCARKYCYISLNAGSMEHSLLNEVLPLLTGHEVHAQSSDMAYLSHLLYLKGYSFESLVTREMKTTGVTHEEAAGEMLLLLKHRNMPAERASRRVIEEYVRRTYPGGKVTIQQGGRFGKVLIRLQDLNMYSRAGGGKR